MVGMAVPRRPTLSTLDVVFTQALSMRKVRGRDSEPNQLDGRDGGPPPSDFPPRPLSPATANPGVFGDWNCVRIFSSPARRRTQRNLIFGRMGSLNIGKAGACVISEAVSLCCFCSISYFMSDELRGCRLLETAD